MKCNARNEHNANLRNVKRYMTTRNDKVPISISRSTVMNAKFLLWHADRLFHMLIQIFVHMFVHID